MCRTLCRRLYGVDFKLLEAVKSFYVDRKACVRTGNEVTEWFSVNVAVRQGRACHHGCSIFIRIGIVREVQTRKFGRRAELVGDGEEKWKVSQLLLSDDTVLVADSKKKLEGLVEEFGSACGRRKLKLNVAKSKVMRSARDGIEGEMNIMMDGLE